MFSTLAFAFSLAPSAQAPGKSTIEIPTAPLSWFCPDIASIAENAVPNSVPPTVAEPTALWLSVQLANNIAPASRRPFFPIPRLYSDCSKQSTTVAAAGQSCRICGERFSGPPPPKAPHHSTVSALVPVTRR